jgi:hypothetical protein
MFRVKMFPSSGLAAVPAVLLLAGLSLSPIATVAHAQAPSPSPTAEASSGSAASDDELTDADYAEMGEAGPIVRDLRKLKNKSVYLIYDVSGSMKANDMLRRVREAATALIRRGTFPGDEVIVMTFGAGYTETRTPITRGADRPEAVSKIPRETVEGSGSNIRTPHHNALKQIDRTPNRPAAIIILTDSFNDEPKPDDTKYADYRKYYTPGGMLTKYPKTTENSDYERLLTKLVQSAKVKQYGVGINFAESGRPIERLPQAAPPVVEVAATPSAAQPINTTPEKSDPTLWIILGLVAAAAVGGFVLAPMFKSSSLRITGGPGGVKDFALKSGTTIRLGGDGANYSPDAYPLPGVSQTVAQIRVKGGRMSIAPPGTPAKIGAKSAPAAPPTGNETSGPRVFHNGLPLEAETPMGYGDEVRVSIPNPGGVAKEYRLKFEDPKKGY